MALQNNKAMGGISSAHGFVSGLLPFACVLYDGQTLMFMLVHHQPRIFSYANLAIVITSICCNAVI
jgi:hypothetical protein